MPPRPAAPPPAPAPHKASARANLSAGTLFSGLAALVLVLVVAVEAWRGMNQHQLLQQLTQVQQHTIPETLKAQRMVRNLEAIRLEGEKMLAQSAVRERMQSMYVVDVIVASPAVREDPRIAPALKTAQQTLIALSAKETIGDADRRAWAAQSLVMARLADQLTTESIEHFNQEIEHTRRTVDSGYWQLGLSLAVLTASLLAFVLALYAVLIRPLRHINNVLEDTRRGEHQPRATPFGVLRTRETRSIERAIGQLQVLMQENETIRAGLEASANTDSLTGLYNRRHFMDEASQAFARARRSGNPLTVAIADLDHFKAVNDSQGHAAGDLVLKSVAERIRDTLRQTDIYCRYGGEEFAFVFPDTSLAEACVLANRLREAVATMPFKLHAHDAQPVTISIGMVEVQDMNLDMALNRADQAMYSAKAAGRNRIEFAPTQGFPEPSPAPA